MTEHAGRRSLIVAILGMAASPAFSGAVAAMERTGHRLASIFLPPVIRRPASRDQIPHCEPDLFEGERFVVVRDRYADFPLWAGDRS